MDHPGNANTLTYDYEEARRSSWFKKNLVLPGGLPPAVAVAETRVLREQHWPRITVQLLTEPAYVTPILLYPPRQIRLILNLSGAIRLAISSGGQHFEYDTGPGTVMLTTPHHLPYELQWVPLAAEPVRTAHVYLSNELLAQTAEAAGLNAARVELREGSGIADPLLFEVGRALAHELAGEPEQESLYAETAAQLLAAHLLRRHCVFRHQLPDHRGQLPVGRLRQVRDYVQAHLGEAIRLEELAGMVSMSAYHFCRVFKRTTGLTPQQFVISQRMARAAELLRHSGLTVKEVAAAVGYASHSHFTQLFVRCTSRLPTDYLKTRLQ